MPLFIFSTPRSGSTLLLRLIDATGRATLSGENGGLITALRTCHRTVADRVQQQSLAAFDSPQAAAAAGKFPAWWQASPHRDRLAGLAYSLHWMLAPPYHDPEKLWGCKEIRLGIPFAPENPSTFSAADAAADLAFLRELFGATARFLFLVRDPAEIRASLSRCPWWPAPDWPVEDQAAGLANLAAAGHGPLLLCHTLTTDFSGTAATLAHFGLPLPEDVWLSTLAVRCG